MAGGVWIASGNNAVKNNDTVFGFNIVTRPHEYAYICYDPETYVVYYCYKDGHRASITEYYVNGPDGKPELAVYGVNYARSNQ